MSEIYKQFMDHRIVHRKDILEFFAGDEGRTSAALHWLTMSGKAQRIKVALYYFKCPDEWYRGDVIVSPWLIASRAVKRGVLGYQSALQLLGEAYSESNNLQTAVSKGMRRVPKAFDYQHVHYQFYRADLSFGITENVVDDLKIKTFDRERLVMEGLMHPDRFYGMSEFLESVDDLIWLDLDHLFELLPHYPLPTASMRLGWLLEKYKKKWYVENSLLIELKKHRPGDRVFLVSKIRTGNVLVKTWNLMVPKTLLTGEV